MQRLLFIGLLMCFLVGCSTPETGSLQFIANGEDFVRQGFVSKDGWTIAFENLQVTLTDIQAYQTTGFDPSGGDQPDGDVVGLGKTMTIDLADGGPNANPIEIGTIEVPVGQYQAISWAMVNNGPYEQTISMIGTAEKETISIPFIIMISDNYAYTCGEFVGDERKGFVSAESSGNVELTFHFDHIFGDIDADEDFNNDALGFQPFADLADADGLTVTQSELEAQLSSSDYATLIDTLATLGHVGEGHCFEATNGYTGE